MNRRDVIQKFLLGGTVLVLAPSVFESCSKPQDSTGNPQSGKELTIDLTLPANSALTASGGSKVIQDILVINAGNGNYIALSSICTHQGCTVAYDQSANNVKCPCHGSVFSATGSVVNGPASSPLQGYPVNKSGNTLTISL